MSLLTARERACKLGVQEWRLLPRETSLFFCVSRFLIAMFIFQDEEFLQLCQLQLFSNLTSKLNDRLTHLLLPFKDTEGLFESDGPISILTLFVFASKNCNLTLLIISL